MADIKWIKITTDIFDDEKILLIESLPEAESIIVIWFKLLCLAGKMNNSGVFMMNDKIAYTDKMLATIFRRKESIVRLALKTFEQFGMVEIIDGVITIPNWGKHQNLEQLEDRKRYQREYQREYRKKQKLLTSGENKGESEKNKSLRKHLHNDSHKPDVNTPEEEKEEEKEEDKDIDIDSINDDMDDEDPATGIVEEFANRNGLTMEAFNLLHNCDAKTRQRVAKVANTLFSKVAGSTPTEMDEAKVYSWIVESGKVSNDKIYILTCAFYKAADAGHRGQWNYIEGILSDMVAKGVRTKEQATEYFYTRKDDS